MTLLDLEINLVRMFGWSLSDIDDTYVESLWPFLMRFNATQGKGPHAAPGTGQRVFCDQAEGW